MPLYRFGEADGWFFLVLEYLPGGTLKQRLAEPLPPRIAAWLVETIARAVGYLHGRGLLHLDLKPSNILLDCEPNAPWDRVTPKIADFGLALSDGDAVASEMSLAGIRGTPSYMAPEQAAESRAGIGAAADIHALGAILYELLTGRPPFQGTSTLETLDQVRGQNPVSPRRLNPKIPRDLETITLKCLEKNPSRRYASAEALADDLNRLLAGRPIQARPVSPIEHAWRWCRRQPLIASLAATLLLTLLGGFLGLLALLRRSEAQRARSEANFRVASRSLDEFSWIVAARILDKGVRRSDDDLVKALENARSQEIELSKRYPLDVGCLKRLAAIERHLGAFYIHDGKPEEARLLFETSLHDWEACLALAPDDVQIHRGQFGSAALLLRLLMDSRNDHLYERWNARTIRIVERMNAFRDAHIAAAFTLSTIHRQHADSLICAANRIATSKELEEDLRLASSIRAAEPAVPAFVLSELLALAALGRLPDEYASDRAPIHLRPERGPRPDLEAGLGELTARRIGLLPSSVESPLPIPQDLSADAWTDRVISWIRSDAATFGLDPARIPAIGWFMLRSSSETLASQIRAGKLGDAGRSVDRLLALAERLRRSYPDQAAPYMLLSEGYLKKAKIAYRVDGEPVIGWERESLAAAVHAATIEPGNAEALDLVKNRRSRLDRFTSKQ